MKFSINQSELQNVVSAVIKGTSSRSTLPILAGIQIKTSGNRLVFQATDLELSIQYEVDALIEEEGATVVPGKLFSDIVKSLPDAAVTIESTDEGALILCGSSSFSIRTLNAEDFPGFPTVEVDQSARIPFARFVSMVKKVSKVVSRDESRAILTGVLITIEGKHLKMVATDSYRLAVAEADIEEEQAEPFSAVITGSFLQDIASLPKSDEYVQVALSENQIVVTYEDTIFINRRLEGNFPNYRQLLPEAYVTRAALDVGNLAAAVKRISLLNTMATPIKIDINIESQTVQLSSAEQDVGSAQETLACEAEGEDVEIAFNYTYILDGLNAVTDDTVYLEVQNSMKPGIFKTEDEENYLYLVMPVRIP